MLFPLSNKKTQPLFLTDNGLFQKKTKQGDRGFWGHRYFFKPPPLPGIFRFFTLPLEIPDRTRLTPRTCQNCFILHLSEILRPKTKTCGNSMLFLINPQKIHYCYFFWIPIPGNSMSSSKPPSFFFFFLEYQPKSNKKYMPFLHCISSFEGRVLLTKICARYNHQTLFLLLFLLAFTSTDR